MALPATGLLIVILMACGSAIQLDGNGYTDVLFAINPAIPEDQNLLQRIQDMVMEASRDLYGAVGQRFYFKNVTILVPAYWTGNYSRAKTETYEKANVIIDEPNKMYGDEPYTLQYGHCGQQGQYIHLTPNFLLNDTLVKVYGNRSKVFVHEWGHLRWGLYDEYSEEQPFYLLSNDMAPEATRCSIEIKGKNCLSSGKDCEKCTKDNTTSLPTSDCLFLPYNPQPGSKTATESIMTFQSLEYVTKFCSNDTHNDEAPNRQNQMCDNRAALDVILRSSVDKERPPLSTPISQLPTPFINIVQRERRVVCLVLDVSSSMAKEQRHKRLRQAGTLFLQTIIEDTAFVGIVEFEISASPLKPLTEIVGEDSREALIKALPTSADGGGTNICTGIDLGLTVLKENDGSTEGDELIVLTDGEGQDDLNKCKPAVESSGARVHTIALGPHADKKLHEFADITGGIFLQTSDSIDSNELIDAFASLTTSDGNLTQQTIQLESSGERTTDWFNGTFFMDWTVGKDTMITVVYEVSMPNIHIVSPSGETHNHSGFYHNTEMKMLSLKLPEIAAEGTWNYSLLNMDSNAQSMAITVTSHAASADVSPIIVTAFMDQKTSDLSKPPVVYAAVTQNKLPVIEAKVTAVLESDVGHVERLILEDNGAGADAFRLDGIYSRYFVNVSSGQYSLKVRVQSQDKTKLSTAKVHSGVLYIPGYVVDGNVEMNPPKPPISHEPVEVGSFSRTATGESFVVTLPTGSTGPPAFPPSKITDLRAKLEGEIVKVTWTAPGARYDQGRASRYHLAWSEDLTQLRTNFSGSHHVDPWELTPQDTGSTEQYSFLPNNLVIKNGTVIFVAVVAENADSLNSSISNIERVMKVVPVPTVPEEKEGSLNVIGIAVGTTVGVVAIASVVGTVICWKKR